MWNIVFIFTLMMDTGMTVVPVERDENFGTKELCEATRAQIHEPVVQAVASSCVDRGLPA